MNETKVFYLSMIFSSYEILKKLEKEINRQKWHESEISKEIEEIKNELIANIEKYFSLIIGKKVEFKGISRMTLTRVIEFFGTYQYAVKTINDYNTGYAVLSGFQSEYDKEIIACSIQTKKETENKINKFLAEFAK